MFLTLFLSSFVFQTLFSTGLADIPYQPKRATTVPSIQLDNGTFIGVTSSGVSKFLGIPFAQPPVGQLRFRQPQPVNSYTGVHNATSFGPSCIQQALKLPILTGLAKEAIDYVVNSIYNAQVPADEDCLTLDVFLPDLQGETHYFNLPVVVWFFGGGFEDGGVTTDHGENVVARSTALNTPIIYVNMNYRLSGFGFLGGQEVKDAGVGNLGLQDQRQALRWVQKYISAFGGDPKKVTIWGESAGAISVALQMVSNDGNTEGLFRGAFMNSGSPIPVGDISNGQQFFDAIVQETGCSGSADKLDCLRRVPFITLKSAVDRSPGVLDFRSLNLAWLPRTDGVFLTDTPQRLVQDGKVANVPFVNGDCDDEGTFFSLSTLNLTTEAQFKQYVKTDFFPAATDNDLETLAKLYPGDITQGSPYDTLIFNAITPQYKRIASFLGDAVFQAPRRFFLRELSGRQNTWSFLSKHLKALPVLGSVHGSDLLNPQMADFLINFVVRLDPNPLNTAQPWPKYTVQNPTMLTFVDSIVPITFEKDNFRLDAINFLINVSLAHPL